MLQVVVLDYSGHGHILATMSSVYGIRSIRNAIIPARIRQIITMSPSCVIIVIRSPGVLEEYVHLN